MSPPKKSGRLRKKRITPLSQRRTNVDEIVDALYQDIVTLRLMPGTTISEVEIANQFEVSRQPVRDAFARLGTMGFLLIRPQKATVVRKFSVPEIAHARFVRTAIEVEVLRFAIRKWPDHDTTDITDCLARQEAAVKARDSDQFHQLDYDFHSLLAEASGFDMAFQIIAEMKAKVDRLCMLALEEPTEMSVLLDDHKAIIAALDANDPAALEATIRSHLARLDPVVRRIQQEHSDYFE